MDISYVEGSFNKRALLYISLYMRVQNFYYLNLHLTLFKKEKRQGFATGIKYSSISYNKI